VVVTWQNLGLPHMHAVQSRGSRFTDSLGKPKKNYFYKTLWVDRGLQDERSGF